MVEIEIGVMISLCSIVGFASIRLLLAAQSGCVTCRATEFDF